MEQHQGGSSVLHPPVLHPGGSSVLHPPVLHPGWRSVLHPPVLAAPILVSALSPQEDHTAFSLSIVLPMDQATWEKTSSLIRDDVPDPPPPMPLMFLPLKIGASTHFALLDSGASDSFISAEVVRKAALRLLPLKTPVRVRVANGEVIPVSHFVRVNATLGTLRTRLFLRVIPTPLPIVLGYPSSTSSTLMSIGRSKRSSLCREEEPMMSPLFKRMACRYNR